MPNGRGDQRVDLDRHSDSTPLEEANREHTAVVVSDDDSAVNLAKDVASPKKGFLAMSDFSDEECRVCQQEKEEVLIDLGCRRRGTIAKSHRSCIETWFRTRGSNKCEICQDVVRNVPPPESQPIGCFSPLWVAFSILIGGLLLDVLISVTLGLSVLPVNIIIGVIVLLGLGTALRLALEFCREWSVRRVGQRVETNVELGYHPPL